MVCPRALDGSPRPVKSMSKYILNLYSNMGKIHRYNIEQKKPDPSIMLCDSVIPFPQRIKTGPR